ncbi:hypothetical protein EOD39_4226 [Acipenser ruthenus]|uniref:Uncharacterized protein n=1 Tax=Acipenser ruthenus TaxID=7906 RepID=A0A444UJA2_ACIRT|nr:hypothetical protein EOD39_4226 [Acipenser ruthenus]
MVVLGKLCSWSEEDKAQQLSAALREDAQMNVSNITSLVALTHIPGVGCETGNYGKHNAEELELKSLTPRSTSIEYILSTEALNNK